MKFTSEDLMKAMGLVVGDKVKVKSVLKNGEDTIYTIDNTGGFCLSDEEGGLYHIINLIDQDFEILPKPKKIGELKCGKKCSICPLRMLDTCCNRLENGTLYEYLELVKDYCISIEAFDQEIYDLVKARLDKEVQDND